MALQAALLKQCLEKDGAAVTFLASNFELPGRLQRLAGLRTAVRALLIWIRIWHAVRQVDVVHVFAASWLYFFVVVSPSILVGRILRKRTVLNYRGGDARAFFGRWSGAVRPIVRTATLVTAPSQFLAQLIQTSFDVPVTVVPNILDTSTFEFQRRSAFQPTLLVNRNLEKLYDVASVLRAFRRVQESYPEASLWIAGSGSEEAQLRSLAAEWKLDHVRFLGHVNHAELPEIYNQRDILVNASTVDNFPAALLEASAAGLVVVSTDAGGIPFLYRNGTNALLVEVGDWQALATAVGRVIRDPGMAAGLAGEAHRLTRQCAWEIVRQPLYLAYGIATENGAQQPAVGCEEVGDRRA
jgi:glycosyltransferase involved in cell wall biosynthesis